MPYCPQHGEKPGAFCDECAAPLTSQPPGDTTNIRSSQASAALSQSIYLPGSHAPGSRPNLLKCPQCGRRNPEHESFDCQGECRRENLCLRHFDEEYEVCVDCARSLRQEDQKQAKAAAALRQALADWQGRAEKAEQEIVALARRLDSAQNAQAQAEAGQTSAQNAAVALRQELARWKRQAEQAEEKVTGLTQQVDSAQKAQIQAETARAAAKKEATSLGSQLAEWKKRAESAEETLAAIRRAEEKAKAEAEEAKAEAEEARRKAEAKAKAEAEEARRKAEAGAKVTPLWKQLGIDLIPIPAGDFLYGDDKRTVGLGEFSIARTTITNAQYKAFVDATKRTPPQHWANGRLPAGQEQHPVVYVSWDDAVAFCEWAGVRLPTEQEWEKAARGTDGRTYPWGEAKPDAKRCNFGKEYKIENLAAVGKYPAGASPYGLMDMAGNVWEWCVDYYDNQENSRVLRGGAFLIDASLVRCAYRHWSSPVNRLNLVGFRVASSPGS